MQITTHLVAVAKRNDMKELMALILDENGKTEEAANVRAAGRKTVKLIDDNFIATDVEEVADMPENEAPVETEDETATIPDHDFKDIRKAIKKGKGKKALKLIVAAKDAGARGGVLKDLKRQAEEL